MLALSRRRLWLFALVALLVLAAWVGFLLLRGTRLPAGATGALVFVSDRDGRSALYLRRLPRGLVRRLTFGSEPVGEPAISPDATRVAFAMGGRIGIVPLAGGQAAILTLGVDWQDAQPAWLADGRRLVVSARRRAGEPAGLHLLDPRLDGRVERRQLTQPSAGDDLSPVVSPDGLFVVFVRQDHLMRLELADGRVRLLSGGFKRERSPRFLPSGRLVFAWSEGKRHGIDTLGADGRGRRTLVVGGRVYRSLAPSPDGLLLAATLGYDLASPPLEALFAGSRDSLRLLDEEGRDLGPLEASRAHANQAADWSR